MSKQFWRITSLCCKILLSPYCMYGSFESFARLVLHPKLYGHGLAKKRYTIVMRREVVSIASFLALSVLPVSASAASLYIDPNAGTYGVSDTFVAAVRLDSGGDCVNAAHVEITYPVGTLKAVDFSRGSSIFSLWVEEPKIDAEKGIVSFSGGIPGGYCGRIPGDPALSNILGKIIFTVVGADDTAPTIAVSPKSELYLNDGLGTKVTPDVKDATFDILPTPVSTENPWINEVKADTVPPDSFDVQVESTRGIFGGKYYIVFSTVDKQSGLDHYELFERGGWKHVTSPYRLYDQSLADPIQVKAIDKAGNERMGTYIPGSAPPRQYEFEDFLPLYIVLLLLLLSWIAKRYLDRRAAAQFPSA